jgi:uncharacterized membrane protein
MRAMSMSWQSVPHVSAERLVLLAILLLAAVLRLIGANSELWFDEIVTVQEYVRLPAGEILRKYDAANNHVLNSLLAHGFVVLWGEKPWVIRLPSILFGIAGVWAFFFVARVLWSSRCALLGTLLFALSYYHVIYTQNARGYSAFVFFALLATGILIRLLKAETATQTRVYGLAYAGAIGLGLYALLLMVFVVLGHACVLLVLGRWRALRWMIAGGVVAMLPYAPMWDGLLTYYTEYPSNTGNPLWSAEFFHELKPISAFLILGALVAAPLLVRLMQRDPIIAALLVVPLILNILLPLWRVQGIHPRSLIYALPLAHLILVEGIDWAFRRVRWLPWVLASVVVVGSLALLVRFYALPKQGFQQALGYIATHRALHDDLIGLTLGGKAARFYDPSVVLIEDANQLEGWLRGAQRPAWVLYTFERELRGNAPDIYAWVTHATVHRATFPGVIGDGEVHVRLWRPDRD